MEDTHARLTYVLQAPAERVLAHFTDPELLVRWWPTGAETDPVPGGSYHVWWDGPDWHLRGRYVAVSNDALVWTWAWDHDDVPERTVKMSFESIDTGTLLSIDHEAGDVAERATYLEGWEHFLPRLAQSIAS